MKKQSILLTILLISNGSASFALSRSLQPENHLNNNSQNSAPPASKMFKDLTAKFNYTYIDFNFNSTEGNNYNRFQGHSDLYSTGAENIRIGHGLFSGIYLYRINTRLNNQFQLAPSGFFSGSQTINNNTIFAHLLKTLNSHFFVDISGAYGQNSIVGSTQFTPTVIGFTTSTNHNWFVSMNSMYHKLWKNFILKGNIGALYSQVDAPLSDIVFLDNILPSKKVDPLTNKTVFTFEGAEIGYKINSTLTPFINGSLIQVIEYSNSRSVIPRNVIGVIPQLEMNKNAYKLGGGIAIKHRRFSVRLEHKYYTSGGTFNSYLTTLGLAYHFS